MIADYQGTVLIVSHDRDFLDRTVTVTLGLDGSGKVDIVAGGYGGLGNGAAPDVRLPAAQAKGTPSRSVPKAPLLALSGKPSYKDQRGLRPALPGEIEKLEAPDQRPSRSVLADPDLYTP